MDAPGEWGCAKQGRVLVYTICMVPSVGSVWSRAAVLVVVVAGVGIAGLTGCDAPADDGPEPAVPQAWTALCDEAAADACLADGPLRCGDGVPRAACETCGCPGGDACVDGPGDDDSVCASADVQNAVRVDDVVSDGLADTDYLALYGVTDGDDVRPITLADLVGRLQDDARRDGRRQLVVVGREAGDAGAFVSDAIGTTLLDAGDGTCAALATAAAGVPVATTVSTDDVPLTVVASSVDDATQALCAFPGSVPRCVLPHRQSCLLRGGAVAPAVVVVDDAVFLARLDDALLRSVARVGRATWEQRLDSTVLTFSSLLLEHQPEARFNLPDAGREVRVVELAAGAGVDEAPVFVAWLPNFRARPVRSLAFRLLWQDGPLRQFLTVHDVVPADCAFDTAAVNDAGDPTIDSIVGVDCRATDGAALTATVNVGRNAIVDSATTEPPP
jgi:hypothetical protein